MKYSFLIALREYAEHVKTRGFLIGLLLFPVMLYVGIRVPKLIERFTTPTRYFSVIDPTGELTPLIDAGIKHAYDKKDAMARLEWLAKKQKDPATPDFKPRKPMFVRVPLPAGVIADDPATTIANAKPYLLGDSKIRVDGESQELFALIVLPERRDKIANGVQYWATNLTDDELSSIVSRALQDDLRGREYAASGIALPEVQRIASIEVKFDDKDPRKSAGQESAGVEEKIRQWAPLGFVYLMFVAMITVAQMLLSSTIEEKSSRIFEVLLSSVTSGELMVGKLIGVAGVGVTMLLAWLTCLFVVLNWFGNDASEIAVPLIKVVFAPSVLTPLVAYFLLGFLLYASLLLALGSLCNTIKEAQNFMGPVMMAMMVPVFAMVFVAKDPNGMLAHILTWIPPFTPFVMMNRIGGNPSGIEVAGTLAMLVVCVILMLWIAARIFRNGVLRTGAPPKFVELLRLLRA